MLNSTPIAPAAKFMSKMHACGSEEIGAKLPFCQQPLTCAIDALSMTGAGSTYIGTVPCAATNTWGAVAGFFSTLIGGFCLGELCVEYVQSSHYIKAIKDFQNHMTPFNDRIIRWIVHNQLHEDLEERLGGLAFKQLMENHGAQLLKLAKEENSEYICCLIYQCRDLIDRSQLASYYFIKKGAAYDNLSCEESLIERFSSGLFKEDLEWINYENLSDAYKRKYVLCAARSLPYADFKELCETKKIQDVDKKTLNLFSTPLLEKFEDLPFNIKTNALLLDILSPTQMNKIYKANSKELNQKLLEHLLENPGKLPLLYLLDKITLGATEKMQIRERFREIFFPDLKMKNFDVVIAKMLEASDDENPAALALVLLDGLNQKEREAVVKTINELGTELKLATKIIGKLNS